MPIDGVLPEVQSRLHRSGTERNETEKQPEASADGGTSEEMRDHCFGRTSVHRPLGRGTASEPERAARKVVGGTPRTSGI